MTTRKNSLTRRLILTLSLVVVLIFDAWVTYEFLTSKAPGANNFYPRYGGARAFWIDHLDPYDDQASLQIQMGMYGRVVGPSEDPGYFAYPFYTVFLVGPFAPLPYPWAEAIWLALLEACLVGAFLLLVDLFSWRPPRWLLILGVVWSLVFYPAARGLLLGQPGILVYCLEALTLWALARQYDTLAGAALAVSTIKPHMGFLIVPFLIVWGIRTRRWRFVGSFVALWGVLMLASFALQPSWLGEWLNQLRQYPTYAAISSPVWVITNVYLPFLGNTGELVIDALLVVLLLWAWYRVLLRGDQARFDWTVALTLTITHLIAPYTVSPHFVVFALVFVFFFREMIRTDPKDGTQLVAGVMISTTVVLWALFLTTLTGNFEHPINYLPLPFGALIALLVWRRRWWEARPTIRATGDALVPVNSAA